MSLSPAWDEALCCAVMYKAQCDGLATDVPTYHTSSCFAVSYIPGHGMIVLCLSVEMLYWYHYNISCSVCQ